MKIFYTSLLVLLYIHLNAQISNDNCIDATPIGEVIDDTFSNIGATTDGPLHLNSPCPGSGEPELDSLYNDIWYLYTPTFSGTALFSLCGTANFDTKIAVYQPNASCPPLDEDLLSCNEDAGTCANSTSELIFQTIEGDSYLLRIAGFGTESPGEEGEGLFSVIEFVPEVSNDFCFSAISVTVGEDQAFNSFGATTDGPIHDPANPCFQFGDNTIQSDIWYTFTPDFSGPVLWATCNDVSFDSRLGVYGPDANCSDLVNSLLACNDDGSGCANYSSSLFFEVEEGLTYILRLGGFGGASGDGAFDLINQNPPEAPTNDSCVDAIPVELSVIGNNESNPGSTFAAGFDPANFVFPPCIANTNGGEFAEVWYSFNNNGIEEIILNFFSLTPDAAYFIDVWETCSTPTDTLVFLNNCTNLDATISPVLSDTLGLFSNTPTDYILRVSTRLTSDIPGDFEFQLLGIGLSGFESPSALDGNVKLTPNPVSTSLNLEIPLNRKSSLSYSIHDLLGKAVLVKEQTWIPSGIYYQYIEVQELNPGVYIINLNIDNEPIGIKFVKH